MNDYLIKQLQAVREAISQAAIAVGKKPETVRLVAVSKTFPAANIETAYGAEQRLFGENRVQELAEKTEMLPDDIEWHLIGHLQSNKVNKAVAVADYIHAVDSVKLIERIDRLAGEINRKPKILFEINISGEVSKFGTTETEAMVLATAAVKCDNLEFVGLMTMAPYGADESELHHIFSSLRQLRDNIATRFAIPLPELSMGMSADYKIAIAEGATFVRVGSAIFGKR
ncbi:MAG: YggS family pyridoxal phosphate-dependent enzyme [Victivallaceae bacterium]|nr:YggS family pyridoxal phosphate-dependent enzyme [Victivallaceae bacterium]